MTIKYKVKKIYSRFERWLHKYIEHIKMDKRFYLSVVIFLIAIVMILLSSTPAARFTEVEIKNVGNYTFQITTEGLEKSIPFANVRFVQGEDKNILVAKQNYEILYIYRSNYDFGKIRNQ